MTWWGRWRIGWWCAIGEGSPGRGTQGDQLDADQLSELLRSPKVIVLGHEHEAMLGGVLPDTLVWLTLQANVIDVPSLRELCVEA